MHVVNKFKKYLIRIFKTMKKINILIFALIFIIITSFCCGCTQLNSLSNDDPIIGEWKNSELNDIKIIFYPNQTIDVSPSFGCWLLDISGNAVPGFKCKSGGPVHKSEWGHSGVTKTTTSTLFGIEIKNETTYSIPNKYYFKLNETLYQMDVPRGVTFGVSIYEPTVSINSTQSVIYDPNKDVLIFTEYPEYLWIRV